MKYAIPLALAGILGTTASHAAVDPYQVSDESSVVLSGTVSEIKDDEFTLNYGQGNIVVETEDFFDPFYGDTADALTVGEKVTVAGEIDDDWFEGREIEAHSVVRNDRQQFSSAAQNPQSYYYISYYMPNQGDMLLTGSVKEVDAGANEFTLDYGRGEIQVDTSSLEGNPLGAGGIEQGERVLISGRIDDGVFEQRELVATGLTQINVRQQNQVQGQQQMQQQGQRTGQQMQGQQQGMQQQR